MKKTLNARLKKNVLTDDPNDFVAIVQSKGNAVLSDIIDELVAEGMEIKRETAIDVVSRFNRKAADLALSGYSVNTGLVYMRPVIKGTFYDKVWNAENNSVYITINQGIDLRNAVAETVVEITGELSDPLELLGVTDSTTGKTDGTLSRGRNAELKGSYLKIAGDNTECGISFMNTANKTITKLSPGDIVINEPSRLLILVPATLAPGEYQLSITTQFSGGANLLKQPRNISYDTPIIIA